MTLSRRRFLATMALAGGTVAIGGLTPGWARSAWASQAPALSAGDFKALTDFALSEARRLGCPYADVAIMLRPDGSRAWRAAFGSEGARSVSPAIDSDRLNSRVRVEHSTGWGVAEGPSATKDEMARTVSRAVADARADAALGARPAKPIVRAVQRSPMTFGGEEAYFVSSKGTRMQSASLFVA